MAHVLERPTRTRIRPAAAPVQTPAQVRQDPDEAPLWKSIALLLVVIAFLLAVQMTASFLTAWLVTGHAY